MKHVGSLLPAIASVFLLASCLLRTTTAVPEKAVSNAKPLCHYTARSTIQEGAIPNKVYVFPPLLADIHGNPSEQVLPVFDDKGNLMDWRPPSDESRALRESASRSLKSKGYEVVEFKDVLGMSQPHSVLMVSLFYHKPSAGAAVGKDGRKSILTMIKARTFDTDLTPSKSRAVSDVDGDTRFDVHTECATLVGKSFGILVGWIGDDVSGYMVLP